MSMFDDAVRTIYSVAYYAIHVFYDMQYIQPMFTKRVKTFVLYSILPTRIISQWYIEGCQKVTIRIMIFQTVTNHNFNEMNCERKEGGKNKLSFR